MNTPLFLKNTLPIAVLIGWMLWQIMACQTDNSGNKGASSSTHSLPNSLFEGVWINKEFYEAVSQHDSPYMRFHCSELYFDASAKGDSLWLINCQTDVAQYAYKPQSPDTLFIADWQAKGASIVRLGSDALKLIDHNQQTETIFMRSNTRHIEAETMPPFKYSFKRFINENTIAGKYDIVYPKSAAKRQVLFNAEGTLNGLSDFSKYTLWVGGDIASQCTENLISFNNRQIDTLYGWHLRGDTLLLCNLKALHAADEKPVYEFNKIAIKMVRQTPKP